MLAACRVIEDRLLGSLIDHANLGAAHSTACGVGESYLVIDQRGGVAKCQKEIERPIANVHATDTLGSIRADTIGIYKLAVQEKSGCRDCAWSCGTRVAARSPPSARRAATI
jgi:uncharacterized protein